ncbi:[Fe-Fe] hydrogenase large subunit C-terminal domain-containing protein [Vallitalea okinawensis]|uniref:[Fe-Fe] hydrogenase large subunit C-terminal domain-containing protein n=1 Tax=Vallitalea okinawensis TaxID=2078660 RepID=UPI000CFC53E1|nr:[Fe-Fe] hydrogenase large subunit C-terminal domain-containing protein [Vallitalea okinawensis]
MGEYLPSVKLIDKKCIGCTDCIKRCPTEAIRVRNGKAQITNEKCIDCGLCIKVCRNKAKQATTDSIDDIKRLPFKYKVAIPAPTLYSQFKNITNINIILTAVKELGFDEVYEVAYAADLVTRETIRYINNEKFDKPIISSACPAIVRLIQIKYPTLIQNILPFISPMELMARVAKEHLIKKGIKGKDIGVFFITPCAAKATNVRSPQVVDYSYVDGVIALRDIYAKMLTLIKQIKAAPERIEVLRQSTLKGINWARSGGESEALGLDNIISVDGIENVKTILDNVENGKLENVDFIEGLACTGGCLGGPLTVENCFVAKNRMRKILQCADDNCLLRDINFEHGELNIRWESPLQPQSVLKLDDDINVALAKLEEIEKIFLTLPKIDCGSCGAPTCNALAEDIVMGNAVIEDCIFMLRKKVREMAEEMVNLSEKLPATFQQDE